MPSSTGTAPPTVGAIRRFGESPASSPRIEGGPPRALVDVWWAIGDACGAPACLPECGPGCATGKATIEVPFIENPFGVVIAQIATLAAILSVLEP